MRYSWTMLFLTVPLAAGREGDSCGPQGSCLLCHGPSASVGDACYHIEEVEVDCDKTIHGHPCCVISEECECVQERFHTQIFPPSLPPRECIGYKPAKVDWRPPTIVAILLIGCLHFVMLSNNNKKQPYCLKTFCHICSDNCQHCHHQLLEEEKKKVKRGCIRGGWWGRGGGWEQGWGGASCVTCHSTKAVSQNVTIGLISWQIVSRLCYMS